MRYSHAAHSFIDRRRQNDTTEKSYSKPKQGNRVTWAPNFPSNAMNVIGLHRPPVEWHRASSELASTYPKKHQVHARIFKWIYVRNKQTPTKPRPEHHVLVSHTCFSSSFFSFKLLHRGNDGVRCLECVCCTLQLPHPCCILNQKFITIRPLSRCIRRPVNASKWQHWARWKSQTHTHTHIPRSQWHNAENYSPLIW